MKIDGHSTWEGRSLTPNTYAHIDTTLKVMANFAAPSDPNAPSPDDYSIPDYEANIVPIEE